MRIHRFRQQRLAIRRVRVLFVLFPPQRDHFGADGRRLAFPPYRVKVRRVELQGLDEFRSPCRGRDGEEVVPEREALFVRREGLLRLTRFEEPPGVRDEHGGEVGLSAVGELAGEGARYADGFAEEDQAVGELAVAEKGRRRFLVAEGDLYACGVGCGLGAGCIESQRRLH